MVYILLCLLTRSAIQFNSAAQFNLRRESCIEAVAQRANGVRCATLTPPTHWDERVDHLAYLPTRLTS